jgi:glycosyltransferase involved in cell wall biosynthesis
LSSQRSHRDLIPPKYLPVIRFSDRLVNGIVANCNFVRDHLDRDYHVPARKIRVCYNALDTTRFYPAPRNRPPELADATAIIGVVCVLRAIKGVDTLVEAFARVYRERPGVRLLIAGSGPERHGLERKSQELGISAACLFRDSTSDVLPWLHAIDVFVLPSRSAALSNSLMEAMASGCCAVASRVGGNPELVRDGDTGLLFESDNAESLAEQLQAVVDNPELRTRLAAAGSRFISANFCTNRSMRCIENVYSEFLSK